MEEVETSSYSGSYYSTEEPCVDALSNNTIVDQSLSYSYYSDESKMPRRVSLQPTYSQYSTVSTKATNTDDKPICIICCVSEEDSGEKLIELEKDCNCIYQVHNTCILKWTKVNNGLHCLWCREEIIEKVVDDDGHQVVSDEEIAMIVSVLQDQGATESQIVRIITPISRTTTTNRPIAQPTVESKSIFQKYYKLLVSSILTIIVLSVAIYLIIKRT